MLTRPVNRRPTNRRNPTRGNPRLTPREPTPPMKII